MDTESRLQEPLRDDHLDLNVAEGTRTRPSIAHLMLWTACSALYLAIHGAFFSGSHLMAFGPALKMVWSISVGATLAGAILLVWERVHRGGPVMRQPGHWFLVLQAVLVCLSFSVLVGARLFSLTVESATHSGILAAWGACSLVMAIGYAVGCLRNPSLRWRLVFASVMLAYFFQLLGYLLLMLPPSNFLSVIWSVDVLIGRGAVLIVLGVAIGERIKGIRRDWLHWVGVTTFAADGLIQVVAGMMNA